MKLSFIKLKTSWHDVLCAARVTRGAPMCSELNPSSEWKYKMLIAEHSPIRELIFTWEWEDLPYFSSVHMSRHKIGIEHFVRSQRAQKNRDEAPQNAHVNHRCTANAQTIINMSRERMCSSADTATREAWQRVVDGMREIGEKELANICAPKCHIRGYCPEPKGMMCKEMRISASEYRDFVMSAGGVMRDFV